MNLSHGTCSIHCKLYFGLTVSCIILQVLAVGNLLTNQTLKTENFRTGRDVQYCFVQLFFKKQENRYWAQSQESNSKMFWHFSSCFLQIIVLRYVYFACVCILGASQFAFIYQKIFLQALEISWFFGYHLVLSFEIQICVYTQTYSLFSGVFVA